MGIGVGAYRLAIGTFAPILARLLLRKLQKAAARAVSEAFNGKVHSGLSVTVFMIWIVLLTLITYSVPFCVYTALCTHASPDECDRSFSLSTERGCGVYTPHADGHWLAHQHNVVSATTSFCQSDCLSVHPSPDLRFLLLLSGQVERNPGPDSVSKDNQSQQAASERMEAKLNKLLSMTDDMQSQFDRKFQMLDSNVANHCERLQRQFAQLQDSVAVLQAWLRQTDVKLGHVEQRQVYLDSRLQQLEDEVERQERYSRRSNLILHGLAEEKGESYERCTERVIQLLNQYFPQRNWRDNDIDRAHRLGSQSTKSSRPRPVIVKFRRWKDAMLIIKDREGKTQMRASDGLSVAADLTKQQRVTMAQLQEEGKHAYYSKGKLVVTEPRRRRQYNNRSNQTHNPAVDPLPPSRSPSRTQSGSYADAVRSDQDITDLPPEQTEVLDSDSHLDGRVAMPEQRPSDAGADSLHADGEVLDSAGRGTATTSSQSTSADSSAGHSSPLRGFGRGSPTDTPTDRISTSATSGSGGSGGRGRGRTRQADRADQSRPGVRTEAPGTPVRTRKQSQKSVPSASSQATLPREWNRRKLVQDSAPSTDTVTRAK